MNNNREKILVILVIAALALYVGDRIVLKPYLASWNARGENIKKLTKQLADGRKLLGDGPQIRADWESKKSNSLTNDVVAARETAVDAVRRWAEESNIIQYTVNPNNPRDEEGFISIENRVDVSGSLTQIFNFLYQLEKDPLAIKLQEFNIDTKDNGATFTMGVRLSGLVLTKPKSAK